MSFREFLNYLAEQNYLRHIPVPVSRDYEIAGIIKALEPQPILFEHIHENPYRIAGGLFTGKSVIAGYYQLRPKDLIPALVRAIENPTSPREVSNAPCQNVIELSPDLDSLPILCHCACDGGRYISSGVVVSSHPQWGQNLDFHRFMQISKSSMAVRVVKSRHFDQYLQDQKRMPIAVCVGVSPAVLLSAATSVDIGINELCIANTLQHFDVIKAKTVDLWVPADSEFVIEGYVDFTKLHPEGPFVDLTGTYDIVRDQPIFEVTAITHREDAIWHALLPGGLEHKLLMGMPREPTIFKKVNQVTECLDVHITPGGSSWLHAVVQIKKQNEGDGRKAIEAAFTGHRSCKHVFIVDEDIDIYDPAQVEWAMATRFQGSSDMVVKPAEQGSSLDPSANPENHYTTKIGFDLTKPFGAESKSFERVKFPKVDINRYISGDKDE